MDAIRVVLVDDHPVVRSGIRNQLEQAPDIVVIGEAGDAAAALRLATELTPDVLLLDMELPGQSGVDVARQLHATGSPVRVLALSAYDDEQYIVGLLTSGAAGYLTKEEALERIVAAVRGVARGEEGWMSRRAAAQMAAWTRRAVPARSQLTPREREVLRRVACGWTNDQVAEALAISERTVRFHLTNIYEKLGVSTRAQAIAWAVREGLEHEDAE